MELSKLDARQVAPKIEPFSIEELIQDIVMKFKPLAESNHIKIESHFPSEIQLVQGDIGMIERAISNLIDNAINYTPPKGAVTIDILNADKSVSVQISDTGVGIPEEDLPHIFKRFYRVGFRPTWLCFSSKAFRFRKSDDVKKSESFLGLLSTIFRVIKTALQNFIYFRSQSTFYSVLGIIPS